MEAMMNQHAAPVSTDPALMEPIGLYLEGVRTGSEELLAKAFAPNATITSSINSTSETISLSEFIAFVQALKAQHANLEEMHGEPSVLVDKSVATIYVPFNLKMGSNVAAGIDVFALAKDMDGWRIVHKLYSM
jgi:hypothetical protein